MQSLGEERASQSCPEWLQLLAFLLVKHAARRSFALLVSSTELRNRLFFLCEHCLFSCWAFYCIYHLPETSSPGSSWLFNTPLLWVDAGAPPPSLVTFYLGKVATHVEDLWVIFTSIMASTKGSNNPSTDKKMVLHHIATATLCLFSWYFGYLRIGSVVMFLHDLSDIPLDLVRVCGEVKAKTLQIVSMVFTLIAWAYWRLYFLPFEIVRSIMYEGSYSHLDAANDPFEIYITVKKIGYAILLGSLCVLHYLWYWMMIKKSHREIFGDNAKLSKNQ